MKYKKNILLVRSGYPSKEFVLKRLQELGYFVVVLDSKKTAPKRLVNDWIIANIEDEADCVAKIKEYTKKNKKKIHGILTFWDEAVLLNSYLANYFKLPGRNSYASTQEIKNKYYFRQISRQYKYPAPKSALLRNMADLEKAASKLKFPVVVKPIYGAASAFVVKADNKTELKKYFRFIKKNIHDFWLAPEWENMELYVEEYIDGNEVDIDILMQNGKIKFWSITDNFQTAEPFFIETGWQLPSALGQNQKEELVNMAEKILKGFRIKNGCIHFEAKLSSKGAMPIEINLRMGGDEVFHFIKEVWNVDMVENAAKIATGRKIKKIIRKKPNTFLTSYDFIPETDGIVSRVKIAEKLSTDINLHMLSVSSEIGDLVSLPPKGYDYHGWVSAKGRTAEESAENLRNILKQISFKVKPVSLKALQNFKQI